MRFTTKHLAFALAATLAAATSFGSAHAASTASATFSQSNLYPSSTVQNWGTLSTSCGSGSCSVSLTPAGDTFFGHEFLGFDLSDKASSLTLSSALTSDGATLSTGSFNLDGFGSFAYLISLPDGPSTGFSSTVNLFTVNYNGNASNLFVLNDKNFEAAGHVLIASTGCTGFVGAGSGTNNGSSNNCQTLPPPPPPPGVPEPASLLLLGAGLLTVARKRQA